MSKVYFPKELITAVIFFLFSATQAYAATITSNYADFPPLSLATFTGNGFYANENVTLKVKNLIQPCQTTQNDSSYTPWTITADSNGHFVTTWTVSNCPGDSLMLQATGQTSGLIALAWFTDGIKVGLITVG